MRGGNARRNCEALASIFDQNGTAVIKNGMRSDIVISQSQSTSGPYTSARRTAQAPT